MSMVENKRVLIKNLPKCPNCGTWRLQQQLNPRFFQCLACGAHFRLHIWIPGKVGRRQ